MENCKHYVAFSEYLERKINTVLVSSWVIRARCPKCGEDLKDERVKDALENMYVPEISGILYQAYKNKVEFYVAQKTLSEMGIECAFLSFKSADSE